MATSDTDRPRGWFETLVNALAFVAGALMCLLTLLICVDVFSRYFRLFGMPWSLEVAEYTLYAITFLGAPWVLLNQSHIAIDIAVEWLRPAAKARVTAIANTIGALVCAILTFASAVAWWHSFNSGTVIQQTFTFPEWWMFVGPPPIFLIMMCIFIRWLRTPPVLLTETASDGI
jgi:TRAP-type C4-dicarboxylate transport system permease small subunit